MFCASIHRQHPRLCLCDLLRLRVSLASRQSVQLQLQLFALACCLCELALQLLHLFLQRLDFFLVQNNRCQVSKKSRAIGNHVVGEMEIPRSPEAFQTFARSTPAMCAVCFSNVRVRVFHAYVPLHPPAVGAAQPSLLQVGRWSLESPCRELNDERSKAVAG
ncbi:hypothetical protein IWX47DRAFT_874977 [Phyllosticta citricarpa]